ncbi:FAD/NAD(P)-binding domain-containing protein [Massarina eburnea CBS 473.64]|uniref:FAD/NAD(P)-binding domain-containing protein n=1 Tax=Massarina eburnea CBS 473.64 TaxID=1395130 RepID=A0A6A6S8B7_9PLEO|nr:FAD/NAD(P)-binding domain-containing protein [Massarina eburnea CBS 473.64]
MPLRAKVDESQHSKMTETNGAKPKTGIKVIIVGAGFGGLTTAIECLRQGHTPVIYESFPELKVLGDIISFGSNAGRIVHRWSNGLVSERMLLLSIDLHKSGFQIHKWDTGEIVMDQRTPAHEKDAPMFTGHRGEFHEVVFNYAKEIGVEIHLGQRVENYWENENAAGIVLADGTKVEGDVVVGGDGVRSRARTLILGYEDRAKSSGYAIWRSWFSAKDMLADPETAQFCENGDSFHGWIGPDVHFLFSTVKGGKDCAWVLTHKDDHDIDESWSFPGNLDEVKELLKPWDPMCTKIISKTPEKNLVDWKLLYRDPLPTWVSGYGDAPGHGRMCLVGDAAHPFLPTSTQGATQALEDGVTLAIALRKAGKANIKGALRAYQDIRYERVRKVQKTGETTRELWHKTDWEHVKANPESIKLPQEDWILGHDAVKHAEEVGDAAIAKASA